MTITLGFDVEEFDFPLERGREIDLQTQLAVSLPMVPLVRK